MRYATSNQGAQASTSLQSNSPLAIVTFSNITVNGRFTGSGAGLTGIGGGALVGNSVSNAQLAVNSVAMSNIQDGAITTDKLSSNVVTSAKVAFFTLTTNNFAGSVNDAYVNTAGDTMTGPLTLPSSGIAVGTKELVVVGGKVGIGTNAPSEQLEVNGNLKVSGTISGSGSGLTGIGGVSISAAAIGNAHLSDGAVDGSKLATNAVGTDAISNGAVTGVKIALSTIGVSNMAPGSVSGVAVIDGTISNSDLAAGSISASNIDSTVSNVFVKKAGDNMTGRLQLNSVNYLIAGEGGDSTNGVNASLVAHTGATLAGSAHGGETDPKYSAASNSFYRASNPLSFTNCTVTNGLASQAYVNASIPSLAPYITGASVSNGFVAKSGGTMTGKLTLAADGLLLANSQLVATNGNIGISTNNPQDRLDVIGNIRASGTGIFSVVTGNGAGLTGLNGGSFVAGTVSNAHLAAGSVNSAKIAAGAISNINLAFGSISISNIDSTVSNVFVKRAGDNMTGKLTLAADGLVLANSQLVATNGNIGIGTNNPQNRLDVIGNIRASGTGIFSVVTGNGNLLTNLNGGNLTAGSVTSNQIANGAVTTGKLELTGVDYRYLNADGDTMRASLNMGGNAVTNVANVFMGENQGLSSIGVALGSGSSFSTIGSHGIQLVNGEINEAIVGPFSDGAGQFGQTAGGYMCISNSSIAAEQRLAIWDDYSQGRARAVITDGGNGMLGLGIGALQLGYLYNSSDAGYTTATNCGAGSIQLLALTDASAYMSGTESIGMGACRVTNNQSIVAGDGLVSHGDMSITADSFWEGDSNIESKYVNGAGDTMTGALAMTANGLTVGTNQMVAANGNIGIGTNNPAVKLEVAGNIKASGTGEFAVIKGNAAQITGIAVTNLAVTNAFSASTPVLASADGTNLYWRSSQVGVAGIVVNGVTNTGYVALGSAASSNIAAFATAAQGQKAEVALPIDGPTNSLVVSNITIKGVVTVDHPAANDNELVRKGEMDVAITNAIKGIIPELRQDSVTLAFSENNSVTASGIKSHAEGETTSAIADNSHAEGFETLASGCNSHAEGNSTTASGHSSHSEGASSHAYGDESHAEGEGRANGSASHAENCAVANGIASHAEGYSIASAANSHSGGFGAEVNSNHTNAFIHATGSSTNHKVTLFANTAHFDRLHTFEAANDSSNSVLNRAENDARYDSRYQLKNVTPSGDISMGIFVNGPEN